MDSRLVTLILVCCVSLFCGSIVALSNQTVLRQKVPFLVTIAGILIWLVLLYISNIYNADYETVLFINRLVYVGPIVAIVSFGELIASFVSREDVRQWPHYALIRWKPMIRVIAVATILFVISPLCIQSVSSRYDSLRKFSGYNVQAGGLYPVLIIAMAFFGLIAILRFIAAGRHSTGRHHRSLMWVASGLAITFILSIISNLILPIIIGGNETLNIIGTLSPLFVLFALTYAMLRDNLLDVRSAVALTATYGLVTIVLAAVYIAPVIYILAVGIMGFPFHPQKFIPGVMFATLAAIYFGHLRQWFDTITARLFFRNAYDSAIVLAELNKILVSNTNLDSMLSRSSALIVQNVKPDFCTFILDSQGQGGLRIIGSGKIAVTERQLEKIIALSSNVTSEVIVTDVLSRQQHVLKEILLKTNVGLVVQLSLDLGATKEYQGYALLGFKRTGTRFSNQDIALIDTVSDSLSIAIQNALRFEEIQNFNLTLQQQIEAATTKLKKTNAKLIALDESKDDFISMASHQLRTPLTSVKGYLSMVMDGDAGKVTPLQRKMVGQALTSSQRMVYLIADLLNVSRLKTGKFVIEPGPVDLSKMISQEIGQLRETAASQNLELTFDKPKDFPKLLLDETKTRQVVMNFIDNAVHYTPGGGHITIGLANKPQSIELTVVDTGIGVPKVEQHHLFTKFYRAANARRSRPDGTGLGLFMAKKVILAQGGAVLFKSTEGKGSTFGFTLPKDKLLTS